MKHYVVREVLFEVVKSEVRNEHIETVLAPVAVGRTLLEGPVTIEPFRVRDWRGAEGMTFLEFNFTDLEHAQFDS